MRNFKIPAWVTVPIVLLPMFIYPLAGAVQNPSPLPADADPPLLQSRAIYDANPNHIWNQLYTQFYVREAWDGRTYGGDELDPYLWGETKDLVEGPSHKKAVALLDKFLSTHGERLITDPLKRAMLQRDLWAVFDWLNTIYPPRDAVKEMQNRVGQVMRRLALRQEEIHALPDTYAAAIARREFPSAYEPADTSAAFLPPDLLRPDGEWVCLGMAGGASAAKGHMAFFAGRSLFFAFLRLPGGRAETLAYLTRLREYPESLVTFTDRFYPLVGNGGLTSLSTSRRVPNPNLPQFPVGTEVALVRRMAAINDRGEWTPTPIVESVQIRVFTRISSREEWLSDHRSQSQDVFMARLHRAKLFARESGGLRAVSKREGDFPVLFSLPFDWLTPKLEHRSDAGHSQSPRRIPVQSVLGSCLGCHDAPGVQSMLGPRTIWSGLGDSSSLFLESSLEEQAAAARALATKDENWLKFKQVWRQADR
jgi:hypothetical protein